MSLLQFLRILAARKAIIIAALLSCLVAGVIVTQIIPPRYQAKTRVILDIIKPDPVTGQLMSTQFLRAYVRTQIELIKDYRTSGPVVDALGWASNPQFIAEYAQATNGQGTDIRRWLAQRISDGTDAGLAEGSNILEITYTGPSAEGSKRIADLLRETYAKNSLEARREAASRTADWYREQTDKALRLLTTAEADRSKYAKDHGIVLQPGNMDLESAKLAALSSASAIPFGGLGGQAPPQSTIALDQVNQQIAQAASTLGPNHPVFQALQRQKAVLEAELARQQGKALGIASPGSSTAQIQGAFEAQKSRVMAQRDEIDQLNQMQREIDLKRDQYLRAAQRAAELRMEADVAETGLTPLGSATTPTAPSFPNIPLIIVGSIALGGAIGVLLALLVELMGRRVRSDDDLEGAAGAPVFAIVGDRRDPDGWVRKILRMIDRRSAARRKRAEATI